MTSSTNSIPMFQPHEKHIMVVDDDIDIREILKTFIDSCGYDCTVASDGQMAINMMQQSTPDVIITDVDMPRMDGLELTKLAKSEFNCDVIVMTGFSRGLTYSDYVRLGANDFVQKPVTPSEILTRLNRVLYERHYRQKAQSAHQKLVVAHKELKDSYLDTIHRLVLAAEYKDEDTGDHIIRIGKFCTLLAQKLGLPNKEVQRIGYASPMHDIGKIGIPDQILLKPGKLAKEEFEIMKTHTTIGGKILANSKSDVIQCAQKIALSHHERWNGKGYPYGLCGNNIPLYGRIVALADTFDALTSKRPYKEPYPLDVTLEIMKKERGRQFDPDLFDLFLDNIDSISTIRENVVDMQPGEVSDFFLSARDEMTDFACSMMFV